MTPQPSPAPLSSYVVDIGKCTCFIVKRDGKGKYKCHSFECNDSKQVLTSLCPPNTITPHTYTSTGLSNYDSPRGRLAQS